MYHSFLRCIITGVRGWITSNLLRSASLSCYSGYERSPCNLDINQGIASSKRNLRFRSLAGIRGKSSPPLRSSALILLEICRGCLSSILPHSLSPSRGVLVDDQTDRRETTSIRSTDRAGESQPHSQPPWPFKKQTSNPNGIPGEVYRRQARVQRTYFGSTKQPVHFIFSRTSHKTLFSSQPTDHS